VFLALSLQPKSPAAAKLKSVRLFSMVPFTFSPVLAVPIARPEFK
jgi:hypothetical protein